MRVFKKPNLANGWKCPVCQTADEKEIVLIGIDGTEQDTIIEAEQFHLACLRPLYYKNQRVIAFKF